MNRILTLITVVMVAIPSYSQSVAGNLVSSAGEVNSNNNATISWSLGEIVISSSEVHEGYQFPYELQGLVTAVGEQLAIELKLFPNPVSSVLNLEFGEDLNNIVFELLDSKGQKLNRVTQKGKRKAQLDLRNLESGIYFIRVESQKKTMSYKIIKK